MWLNMVVRLTVIARFLLAFTETQIMLKIFVKFLRVWVSLLYINVSLPPLPIENQYFDNLSYSSANDCSTHRTVKFKGEVQVDMIN